ncbi:MAG: dockerin type I repeat-containing protein, partial [Candidatus Zixiibacteriota bacterium]
TGTLIQNWEEVTSASIGTGGHNLKIAARANAIPPPYTQGIGFPQLGTIPLIKILADIYDIPEDQPERDVRIFIQHDNLDNFSFSNEKGTAIGVITDTILDTAWYECLDWDGDVCLFYQEVSSGPADSFHCCDTLLSAHLDTSNVKIESGMLTVLFGICGDVNCNGSVNILDITYLISYLYKGGPVPCEAWRADVNSNGAVNILDITYLISYLYKGGPDPNCGGK